MKISRRAMLIMPAVLPGVAQSAHADLAAPGRIMNTNSDIVIDLWPAPPSGALNPKMKEVIEESSSEPNNSNLRLKGITRPRLALVPASKPNGSSMLIIPGGGFGWNYFDREGYRIADFLAANGVTCFILFYRLANDGWSQPADVGLADTQRAVRKIREQAKTLGLDPNRIGVIGFSAGGFLAASLATRHAVKTYQALDAADMLDARPTLVGAIYPVISLTRPIAYSGLAPSLFADNVTAKTITTYAPSRNVTPNTSPMFLAHAEDDGLVPVDNSLEMRQALVAQRIAVETHLFERGGHGWDMRSGPEHPAHFWPQLFLNFIRRQGLCGVTRTST